ncbi:MAG TPA: hypothetical protein VGB85_26680 [Nannocystis sp.]|jgi:hypothetical protein
MVPDPSLPLELGFVALTLAVAGLIVVLVRRAGAPTAPVLIGLAIYLTAFFVLGVSGLLADATPPKPLLVLVPALAASLWFALGSRAGEALVAHAPMGALVGLHVFRVPLELMMHAWAQEGALPLQMTFAGINWDIITGVGALLLLPFAERSRIGVLLWNIVGLALLINIVTVAITSLPGPLRLFMNDPPNLLVMRAPYIWLPTFLVQVALAGHILVFRALRRRRDLP